MKKIIIPLCLLIFLSSCSSNPNQLSVSPTFTSIPSATMTQTPLPTAISTLTPTPLPALKAGFPETMQECNFIELKYKPDGTIDREPLDLQMKELSKVEHQWLDDQGITVANVSVFNLNNQQKIASDEYLPFPFITLRMAKFNPTSCTRITFKGHKYMIYGFAGKRNLESTQIGIIHVLYDDLGNKSDLTVMGMSEFYETHCTPELVFSYTRKDQLQDVHIFLKRYGQNPDQRMIDRWEAAQAFGIINNPTYDKNLDSDERFMFLIDPTITATQEEEKQWIAQIEPFVLPGQTIELGIPN